MESLNTVTGCILLLSAILGIGYLPIPAQAAEYTVKVENMKFSPETINIEKGDTVVWVNSDLVPHTVTSLKNKFDSKIIQPNKQWTYTFEKSGEFAYKCELHPLMKGKVSVK